LHDYIAKQIATKLEDRRVLVWYDPRAELAPFIAELRGDAMGTVVPVSVGGVAAQLVEYAGSFFEVRDAVEPLVAGDVPEMLLVYVPGVERDRKGSVLMELEKAGDCYEPSLKQLARNVLRRRYTDGTIDEILAPDRVAYADLARVLSDKPGSEPPSLLKAIFHDQAGSGALLAAWLASGERDGEIEAKEAKGELVKLLRARLGLTLPPEDTLAKMRAMARRYVLGSEFRADLRCPPPPSLDGVPTPAG